MSRPQLWVVLSDLHVPFHDGPLVRKVLALIRRERPRGVILAGDYLDLFSLSSYSADSLEDLRGVTLCGEYGSGNVLLNEVDRACRRGTKKVYLYGNHEDRYFREKRRGDRGKYGNSFLSPTEALRLRERGWEVYEDWKQDSYALGPHLEVMHGVSVAVNAAKVHLELAQGSVMFGHTHRIMSYVAGRRAAFGLGCLCQVGHKGFHYMPALHRRRWASGFGLVRLDGSGDFWAESVQAHRGAFYACGRRY